MLWILIIPVLLGFFVSLLFLPKWIKTSRKVGLLWEDMNKYTRPKNVAASGGIVVIAGFIVGVLAYVAINNFYIGNLDVNLKLFAMLSVILIMGIIGLTDDLLGWRSGGLSKRLRVILAFVAAIPLIAINAGVHSINLPFLGDVNLGLIYPLVLIPLGIAGASTTYNFLAGFNGLETGMGIIVLSFLSYVAYVTGYSWLALVGLIMVASLLAFFFFNKYPAEVFPGDILTYSIGALIACMAILGNFEKIAVFVYIPFIIEVGLKLRGGLRKQSFGKPQKDGSLEMPYNKVYGLTHFAIFVLKKIKGKVYEKDVVYFIFIIQIIFVLLGFLMI